MIDRMIVLVQLSLNSNSTGGPKYGGLTNNSLKIVYIYIIVHNFASHATEDLISLDAIVVIGTIISYFLGKKLEQVI